MSCNSPSPSKLRSGKVVAKARSPQWVAFWALLLAGATALAVAGPAWANSPSAAPAVATAAASAGHPQLPGSRLSGQATLRFFGLQVYHARLWTPVTFQFDTLGPQPLVLELEYLRSLKGQAIAERSIQEMRRGGPFTDEQAARWQAEMARIFPDVKSGDRLTGVHKPGEGAAFWFNDQPVGLIADPVFSRLFFGIWLAPTTSEPAMRDTLLGLARNR
jgi:hypothetical protein